MQLAIVIAAIVIVILFGYGLLKLTSYLDAEDWE